MNQLATAEGRDRQEELALLDPLEELEQQARLAHPGLAGDGHDLRFPVLDHQEIVLLQLN